MICEEGLDWKRRACLRPCILDHEHEGPLQAHHVITQQQLRNHGLGHLRWAVANGVPVCEKGHVRHTSAKERIPLDRLPFAAVQFAEEQGLSYLIERYYAREDRDA